MYKLLVMDMDGTLLNEDKQISDKNKEAIKEAVDKGVHIALCTGRAVYGIEEHIKKLDLVKDDSYSIACSGAHIVNNTRTETIRCNSLSDKDIQFIYTLSKELNINFNLFSNDDLLVPKVGLFNRLDAFANNLTIKEVDFENFNDEHNVTKVTLINEDKSVEEEIKKIISTAKVDDVVIEERKEFIKDLFADESKLPKELLDNFTVVKTSPYTLEVLEKSSNKGSGVEAVAEKLGIKREEIICIGDSGNDKHMIEYAGLGVAMGNAFPEIKEIADYITLTNDEDGVAHVIEKFIL